MMKMSETSEQGSGFETIEQNGVVIPLLNNSKDLFLFDISPIFPSFHVSYTWLCSRKKPFQHKSVASKHACIGPSLRTLGPNPTTTAGEMIIASTPFGISCPSILWALLGNVLSV
jgi:hypothetical protein